MHSILTCCSPFYYLCREISSGYWFPVLSHLHIESNSLFQKVLRLKAGCGYPPLSAFQYISEPVQALKISEYELIPPRNPMEPSFGFVTRFPAFLSFMPSFISSKFTASFHILDQPAFTPMEAVSYCLNYEVQWIYDIFQIPEKEVFS